MTKPRLILVDDDRSLRRSIERLLTYEGYDVEVYESSDRFLDECDVGKADCVVLDVQMPGMNGLETHRQLLKRGFRAPVVFLTAHARVTDSVAAVKDGAIDFLEKPVDAAELLNAVEVALEFRQNQLELDLTHSGLRRKLNTLTPREFEVMQYVAKGHPNKVTAAELGIAEKTVKVHRARVMKKLNLHSIADLVRFADTALAFEGLNDESDSR